MSSKPKTKTRQENMQLALYHLHRKLGNKSYLIIFQTDKRKDANNEFEKDYKEGKVHPLDFKDSLANYIDKIVEPIRDILLKNEDIVKRAYPL